MLVPRGSGAGPRLRTGEEEPETAYEMPSDAVEPAGPAAGETPVSISFFDKGLLAIFAIDKVLVIAALLGFFYCAGGRHDLNLWNRWYSGTTNLNAPYLPLSNWDAQHYLLLADWGYNHWEQSRAFFPLYPILIRLARYFVHNIYLSAFVVNVVLSYVFLYILCLYASHFLPRRETLKAAILVLCYPSAFFLTTLYSEAVFVVLLFGFLLFYEIRRSYWSLPFAVLMPLARGQALFVMAAVGIVVGLRLLRRKRIDFVYEAGNMAAFAAGGALFLLFFYFATGSATSGLDAQRGYVFDNAMSNAFNPLHLIRFLAAPSTRWFAYSHAVVDKLFMIVLLLSTVLVARTRRSTWVVFYIMLLYPVASLGTGGGFPRYSLLCFPFLALAICQCYGKQEKTICGVGAFLLAVQLYFMYRYALNMWVT